MSPHISQRESSTSDEPVNWLPFNGLSMGASCLAETPRSLSGRVTGQYGDRPAKTAIASIRYTLPNKAASAITTPSGARDHQLVRNPG